MSPAIGHPLNKKGQEAQCMLARAERYDIWHRRLGHIGPQILRKSLDAVKGLDLSPADLNHGLKCICADCQLGKMAGLRFSKRPRRRSDYVGDRIHSDLCGPMRTPSLHKKRYAVGFWDDKSGYVWLYFLKTKDEWFTAWTALYAKLKRQHGIRAKVFQCDGEAIYMAKKFTTWLERRGMVRKSTPRATSQLNGKAERGWRTLVNLGRSMLQGAGMHDRYWCFAMAHAAYILNRTVRDGMATTPYEALHGSKPDLSNIKIFGCAAYAKVPEDLRHKWSSKARKCVFLGFDQEKIGYRVLDTKTRRAFVSRNVVFDENLLPAKRALDLQDAQSTVKNVSQEPVARPTRNMDVDSHVEHAQVDVIPHAGAHPIQAQHDAARQENNSERPTVPRLHHPEDRDGVPEDQTRAGSDARDGLGGGGAGESLVDRGAEAMESKQERSDLSANDYDDPFLSGQESQTEPQLQSQLQSLSLSKSQDFESVEPIDVKEDDDINIDEMGSTSLADLPAPETLSLLCLADDAQVAACYHLMHDPRRVDAKMRGCAHASTSETEQRTGEGCSDGSSPLISAARQNHVTQNHVRDYCDFESVYLSKTADKKHERPQDPKTVKQARSCDDWKEWEKAMNAEKASLKAQHTWDECMTQPPKRPIKSKWVLRRKYEDGTFIKWKARLVACGYSQRYGEDYLEVFAPVMRLASLRVLLAIAAWENLNLNHLDITTAFLYGELEEGEDIFMQLPEDFGPKRIVKLRRSLYGLKQASRRWNQKMDQVMRSFGFTYVSHADACLYVLRRDTSVLLILVHVDDKIVAWRGKQLFEDFKRHCNKTYHLKDLGELTFALGMRITRDQARKRVSVDQEAFCKEICATFGMEECKTVPTPQVAKQYLTAGDPEHQDASMLNKPYRPLIGKLLYLARGTRPDIANTVRELSRFSSQPTMEHWTACKRLLRYLRGTCHYRLSYYGGKPLQLESFMDADWANSNDRKSISGMVIKLAGGAVSWSSKKQSTVSLSSTEAEYNSLSEGTREVIWLRQLLKDLGHRQTKPSVLWEDNLQTITWAKDPKHHGRNKHIDVKLHHLRDRVRNGDVDVQYVSTEKQLADIMTKPLGRIVFSRLLKSIVDTAPAGV